MRLMEENNQLKVGTCWCVMEGGGVALTLVVWGVLLWLQRQLEDYQHMFGDWTKKEM
jgi:hypothetical protein